MSDGEELTLRDRVVLLLENLVMQGFDIQDASTWTEMGLDSLDKIEMMMDMEDEFSISIPDAAMEYLDSVEDLIGYLERVIAKKA
jgi:acyl carrier protein